MTEPRKKNQPYFRIFPAVASEGYCCLYGYLRLCRARGETKKDMSLWLKVSFWTIKHHYRLLKRGGHACQGYSECLEPIIREIESDRPDSNTPR